MTSKLEQIVEKINKYRPSKDKVLVQGVVYVIEFESGIKIGRTHNFKSRLRTYKTPWCFRIKNYAYFPCDNTYKAEARIKEALRKFKFHPYSPEFIVGLTFDTVSRIVEKFAKDWS